MIHTSGTTGRPKGVVHTHGSIAAQVDALLEAWAWSDRDRILLVLPLNHVHGLVNVTLCALAAGACCEAPGGFDAEATWARLASGRADAVHGGADDLRPAHRRVGGRRRATHAALVGRSSPVAADGVRLGGAAGVDARALASSSPATSCSSATA